MRLTFRSRTPITSFRIARSCRVLAFTAVAFGSLSPATSFAQDRPITDAERNGARQLYFDGIKLQEEGKFAEALDRFQRALAILPSAVTTRLHVAQCQAQIDRLIEASENYREIARTSLDAKAPEAYRSAQDQAKAELVQVESQIPALEVRITPANAPGLSVTIDDQPTNTAFIGVRRPINPGTHRVVVTATGYARAEQSVTTPKQDKSKVVSFTLQASAVTVVTPVIPPTTQPAPQPAAPPPYLGPPLPRPTAPPPPAYEGSSTAGTTKPAEVDKSPATGYLLGIHVGASVPGGSVSAGTKIGTVLATGATIGLDTGFRFARYFYVGAGFETTFYKGSAEASVFGASNQTVDIKGNGRLLSFMLGYMSSPNSTIGFYAEAGGGYRWVNAKYSLTNDSGAVDLVSSTTVDGAEFLFGAGITVRVSDGFRLIPRVQFGTGSFSKASGYEDKNSSINEFAGDIPSTKSHFFTMIGMSGMLNWDFAK